ncbi:MAG: DNA cytosine methyltransferase, partial [Akkermansia sp.]|nr:DNA cytosine methyltransferase [Akkermansia sp.]
FAGGGGGILAGCLLGWNTVCAVEIEEYPRRILMQRQRDGQLPFFPLWDDVCTFDGTPWRGKVDIITGGFPCQDISVAGKGAGLEGKRSSLWHQMHRIICEVEPEWVFVENSPMLLRRGFGTVLGALAAAGYDVAWCVLGADDMGAPHVRKRLWILAHDSHPHGVPCPQCESQHERPAQSAGSCPHQLDARSEMADPHGTRWHAQQHEAGIPCQTLAQTPEQQPCRTGGRAASAAHPHLSGCQKQRRTRPAAQEHKTPECGSWWRSEPGMGRVAHGLADRVDRLRALGNGQVPAVAATAFAILQLELLNHTATHA